MVSSRTQLRALLNQGHSANEARIQQILTDAKGPLEQLEQPFILSSEGIVIIDNEEMPKGEDHSEKEYFLKGKEASAAVVLLEDNHPVWYLASPLVLEDKLLGVVVAKLNNKIFGGIIADTQVLE